MGKWKDEDVATPELIKEYLVEFKDGIKDNPQFLLNEQERLKVQSALAATEQFCLELLSSRKSVIYMHDLILMAIGYYGGYLTALDCQTRENKPNAQN
jgi:hypothetical protein